MKNKGLFTAVLIIAALFTIMFLSSCRGAAASFTGPGSHIHKHNNCDNAVADASHKCSDDNVCQKCYGSKKCHVCDGTGEFSGDECGICNGTGDCSFCDGTGIAK